MTAPWGLVVRAASMIALSFALSRTAAIVPVTPDRAAGATIERETLDVDTHRYQSVAVAVRQDMHLLADGKRRRRHARIGGDNGAAGDKDRHRHRRRIGRPHDQARLIRSNGDDYAFHSRPPVMAMAVADGAMMASSRCPAVIRGERSRGRGKKCRCQAGGNHDAYDALVHEIPLSPHRYRYGYQNIYRQQRSGC